MPIWTVIYVHGYLPLLVALTVASFLWGDRLVRQAALATLILMAVQTAFPRAYRHVEWAAVITDALLLIVLLRLCLRHPRWWLMSIVSIQLVQVAGHIAKMLSPSISPLPYAILQGGGAYLQLILLSIGLLLAIQTRRSTRGRHVTG